jgi:hypothetical protein
MMKYVKKGIIIEDVDRRCCMRTVVRGPYLPLFTHKSISKSRKESVPLQLGLATYCALADSFNESKGNGRT